VELNDRCPVCGSKIPEGITECGVCGTAFGGSELKCPLCNATVKTEDSVCLSCGASLQLEPDKEKAETRSDVSKAEAPDAKDEADSIDRDLEELLKLPTIGPLKAKILYEAGFTDLRKLKQATVIELMNIRGIGRKSAGAIKAALRDIDLETIRQRELTKEEVGAEYQCPLCGTVVSSFESSCYECGTIFDSSQVNPEDGDRLALSYYDSKLLNSPDNPELWYARGATLMKMTEYEKALTSFDRALEINPDFQTAWVSKAEVYNKQGNAMKAAECYKHIISKAAPAQETQADDTLGDFKMAQIQVTADDMKDFDEELDTTILKPAETLPDTMEETETPAQPEMTLKPTDELDLDESSGSEKAPEPEPVSTGIDDKPAPAMTEAGPRPAQNAPTQVKMDYTKSPPEQPKAVLVEVELRKMLSQRAGYVKPLLLLAKETAIDISEAKKVIAKGVSESKKGDLKKAIVFMNQGIEDIEYSIKMKVSEDLNYLAGTVRELKVSGMDVTKAVDLINASKEQMDGNQFREAIETLNNCLDMIEKIKSA
jgi:tetratricopeptide (TPR) repeat protein